MIFLFKLIKHRGIHDEDIHENTYEAIKNAFNNSKYVGVEFDIRETLDHEFVIFHNAYFNNKLISNTKYKDLPKYVPKLKDILKINSNKIFLLEIKNISSFSKFIFLLQKYNNKKIYVMSFSNNLINKVDINDRHYKIGILNYVLNTNKDIKKLDFICILNSLLNENILNILSDKEVFSYGIFENLKYENVYYIVDQ